MAAGASARAASFASATIPDRAWGRRVTAFATSRLRHPHRCSCCSQREASKSPAIRCSPRSTWCAIDRLSDADLWHLIHHDDFKFVATVVLPLPAAARSIRPTMSPPIGTTPATRWNASRAGEQRRWCERRTAMVGAEAEGRLGAEKQRLADAGRHDHLSPPITRSIRGSHSTSTVLAKTGAAASGALHTAQAVRREAVLGTAPSQVATAGMARLSRVLVVVAAVVARRAARRRRNGRERRLWFRRWRRRWRRWWKWLRDHRRIERERQWRGRPWWLRHCDDAGERQRRSGIHRHSRRHRRLRRRRWWWRWHRRHDAHRQDRWKLRRRQQRWRMYRFGKRAGRRVSLSAASSS
jgi:hypothetical protein